MNKTTTAQRTATGSTFVVLYLLLKDGWFYMVGIQWELLSIDWALARGWALELLAVAALLWPSFTAFDWLRSRLGGKRVERKVATRPVEIVVDRDPGDFIDSLPDMGEKKSTLPDGHLRTGFEGVALIKSFEQLRLKAYKPHEDDVLTIGWGHTSGAGDPKVVPGMTITEQQAQQIFVKDLQQFELAVNRSITDEMTQYQFDAFVSLAYNIGGPEFASSTAAQRFNGGDIEGAAEAMLWWNKSGGKKMNGLVRRREAEKDMFLGHSQVMSQSVDDETELTLAIGT